MKTITGTYYRCEFCGKLYIRKDWADKHHLRCKKDPKNQSRCLYGLGCEQLTKVKEDVLCVCGQSENEWYEKINIFKCNKKDIFIKPKWASNIDLYACDIPIIEIMPTTCKQFKEMPF